MSSTALRRAALLLPSRQRADLAAELLASLDDPSEVELGSVEEWEEAWADELERRAEEAGSGTTEMVPASSVFEDARKRRAARK